MLKVQLSLQQVRLGFCIPEELPDDQNLNMVLILESGFQIILIKLLPHAYFCFRIFNPITLSGITYLFNLAPVRNMQKLTILGYFPILQSTTYTICVSNNI